MPTVSELLAKVRGLSDKRQADVTAEWVRLVRAVAGGQDTDPKKVADLIDRAGRTADDFARDVETYAGRLALNAQAAAIPAAAARERSARAKADALVAAFEQQRKRHLAELAPVLADAEDAMAVSMAGERARDELYTKCPYPAVVERAAAANRAFSDVLLKLAAAEDQRAATAREAALQPQHNGADFSKLIALAKARLPRLDADITAMVAERDRLLAERDAADEARRVP